LAERPLLGVEDGIAAGKPGLFLTAVYDPVDVVEVEAVVI